MKTLIVILIMMQVISTKSQACDGTDSGVKALIDDANDLVEKVKRESYLRAIDRKDYSKHVIENAKMMKPLEYDNPEFGEDYYTVGEIQVSYNGKKWTGTFDKIGKSCVITSMHNLYNSDMKNVASINNDGTYSYGGKIKIKRGFGKTLKDVNQDLDAEIFFQLDEVGTDYVEENGIPNFRTHSDLVILKLKNSDGSVYSDNHVKKVVVKSPDEFTNLNQSEKKYGRHQIRCVGSPYYKTSDEINGSSCSGRDFLWHQEGAKTFENRKSSEVDGYGLFSNVASGPGMSGGACEFSNERKVFALISGGNRSIDPKKPSIPSITLKNDDYVHSYFKALSLLHILDQRIKQAKGESLENIDEICN